MALLRVNIDTIMSQRLLPFLALAGLGKFGSSDFLNEYELGTSVEISVIFKDKNDNPINPTTVSLIVIRSDGTTDTVETITNPRTGRYVAYYTTIVMGDHVYTWTGETPALSYTDVSSGFFTVVNYANGELDLNDSINWALAEMNIYAANPLAVVDADIASVAQRDYNKFLILVEYATVETILGHLLLTDIAVGPRKESLSQLSKQLENRLKRLENKLERLYGYGRSVPIAGYVMADFMERVGA